MGFKDNALSIINVIKESYWNKYLCYIYFINLLQLRKMHSLMQGKWPGHFTGVNRQVSLIQIIRSKVREVKDSSGGSRPPAAEEGDDEAQVQGLTTQQDQPQPKYFIIGP